MPKVQAYGAPQVQEQSLPNVSQNITVRPTLAQGIAEGIRNIGGDVAAVQEAGQRMREEDNAAKTKQAVSAFRKRMNEEMYLNEGAYYSLQGQAAYEGYKTASTRLEDIQREMTDDMDTDVANLFKAASQQYIDSELDTMSRHAAQGRMSWMNDQDNAIVEQAQMDGSLRYDNTTPYESQIKKANSNLAKRNGWSPERLELENEKAISGMYVTAIDNILEQDPLSARDYYDAHKQEILPNLRDDIERKITTQRNDAIVRAGASEVYDLFGRDMKGAREYIRENFEGENQDGVMNRYNTRAAQAEQEYKKGVEDTFDWAVKKIWQGGSIDDIPMEQQDVLQREGLWDQVGSEFAKAAKGVQQDNDYQWLQNEYWSKSPQEQNQIPLLEIKKHTDFETYQSIYESRQKLEAPDITQTENNYIRTRLEGIGVDLNDVDNKNNREKVDAFYRELERRVGAEKVRTGGPVDETRRREIIDQITADVDLEPDRWWGPVPRFGTTYVDIPLLEALTPNNLQEISKETGVPDYVIPDIIQALQDYGIPVTPDSIAEAYKAGQ